MAMSSTHCTPSPVRRRCASPGDLSPVGRGRRRRRRVRALRRRRASAAERNVAPWPSPADAATIPASTTGQALSTRCRRWCWRSCSCCRCFWVVQFFLVAGGHRQGQGAGAAQRQAGATENDLLSLEKLGKLGLDDQLSQLRAGLASAEAERDRVKGLYDGLAGAGNDAAGRATELNKALELRKAAGRPARWRRSRC